MKPGAILVNTARGAIVDELAMASALEAGHLGHAALDVFTQEPLPAGHPLTRLANATLTSHAAFRTRKRATTSWARRSTIAGGSSPKGDSHATAGASGSRHGEAGPPPRPQRI